jgi:hypothetical protein
MTKAQLQNSTDQVEQFTKKLRQISVKQFLRLGDTIAKNLVSGISDAITGLSKVEQIQKRLSKLQLRQQIQNLRGRLKEATGIDAQVINTRIDLLTEKLKEAQNEAGRLGQVFRDIGNAIVNTLRSVIREVIALIAKMLIIKAIKAALSGGGSFALGSIQGIGANGVLTNPGVGDILNSLNTTSTGGLLPSLQTVGQRGAPSMEVVINVAGETRTEGQDLKTAYDTTTRVQRRKGHTSR